MRKLIKVTKTDIKNGKRACETCPIARALRRQGFDEAIVLGDGVWGQGAFMDILSDISKQRPLPRSAKRFINRFDSRKLVKPFNFFVEV